MADPDMPRFESRVTESARTCSPAVVGVLMWIDPSGGRWVAPLGSNPPADTPDAMPAEWMPVKFLRRADQI
jgi:hypothetical protein